MKIIAIDIGYGHIKFVFMDSKGKLKEIKFPTALSFYEGSNFGSYSDDEFYTYQGVKYLVGEDAMIDPMDSRDPDFLVKYAPLFIAHAIKLSGMKASDFNVISTGISILNWRKKVELEKSLYNFTVNGEKYRFKKVFVSAQGQGIIYDQGLNASANVVVVDGGYLTLDAIPFKNGRLISNGAFANHFGAAKIVELVQVEVVSLTEVDYSMPEVNDMVKAGFVVSNGKKIDLTKVIEAATAKYVDKFKATLKAKMGDYLARAETVIIGGGLAYLLKDSKMPANVVFSKKPEFANARGYLTIAGGAQ